MNNISKQIGPSNDVTIAQMTRVTTSYYWKKHENGVREIYCIEPIEAKSNITIESSNKLRLLNATFPFKSVSYTLYIEFNLITPVSNLAENIIVASDFDCFALEAQPQ